MHKETNVPVSAAAAQIGVTPATLHRWRKVGHILAVELPNGHFRIPVSEVERITGAKLKTKTPKHERRFTVLLPDKGDEGERQGPRPLFPEGYRKWWYAADDARADSEGSKDAP